VLMGRETGSLHLLAPLLLTGGKGADLVIRGNVVLNTLSACSTSTLLRDQICINSPSSRQVPGLAELSYARDFDFFSMESIGMFNVLDTDCDPCAIRCASTHVAASPRRTMCLRRTGPRTSRAHSMHRVATTGGGVQLTHATRSSLASDGSCHVARCAP
jgi:hypothetical protein